MPNTCFSYPAVVPPEIPSRVVAQAPSHDPRKIGYPCFSYPLTCYGYPDYVRRMPASSTCFRYRAELPLTMPAMCFSYQPRTRNRGPVPSAPPGLRQMPGTITCFRY
jgi:hypothetical protein